MQDYFYLIMTCAWTFLPLECNHKKSIHAPFSVRFLKDFSIKKKKITLCNLASYISS